MGLRSTLPTPRLNTSLQPYSTLSIEGAFDQSSKPSLGHEYHLHQDPWRNGLSNCLA